MKTKQILHLLPSLLLLLSCEQTINLDHLRPDPKIVLNCVIEAGEPVEANLSRTWFHTDEKKNTSIPDAEVKLYVNDVFQEQLQFIEADPKVLYDEPHYLSAFVPKPSDRLTLVASATGFAKVQATTQLPPKASVSDISVLNNETLLHANDTMRVYQVMSSLQVTIHDDPAKKNYYLIYAEEEDVDYWGDVHDTTYYWRSIDLDFSAEPLFTNQVSVLDRILGYDEERASWRMAFSDELINGKAYTIDLSLNPYSYRYRYEYEDGYGPTVRPAKYRIYLHTISSDYYAYLKMLQELRKSSFTDDLAEIGFSEPRRVFSNVEGGTGALGGSTPSCWEL